MTCRNCGKPVEVPDITGTLCSHCWVESQQVKRPLPVLKAFWDSVIVIEEKAEFLEPYYG